MDVYLSPRDTCAVSALAPCLHSPLTQGVGCAVRASIEQGKGMAWDGSGPPLSSQGWGGLALLVDEEQVSCNGRSPKRR